MIGSVSFIIWVVLAILCGVLASKKNRSFLGYFLLSIVLSPLIGFIAILVMGDKKEAQDENTSNSDTIEFNNSYDDVLPKVIKFYEGFNLKKSDGYGDKSSVYRNEEESYFYLRQQGEKVILQTFKLPKYEAIDPVKPSSNIDDLVKLGELLDKGVLTKEEFEAQKAKLLNA